MNININDNIAVDVVITPKKKKGDCSLYDMYIYFNIFEKGLKQQVCTLSTGINILVTDYQSGKIIGRSQQLKSIETRLNQYLTKAGRLLEDLRDKEIKSCSELKQEINQNARLRILGKVSRGNKAEATSRLSKLTYSQMVSDCLEIKQLAKNRTDTYKRSIRLMNEYFNSKGLSTPTIDQITEQDIKNFKEWYLKTYPQKKNAFVTLFKVIIAVFNFAVETKKIQITPIPKGFGGGFEEGGNFEVLSEKQILRIIDIEDVTLTKPLQIAKYCLLLQALTGMPFCEIKALKLENIKYSEDLERNYIEKNRTKTDIKFTIFQSHQCEIVLNKLIELSGGKDLLFKLTTIDNINQLYKKIGKIAGIANNISTYTLRHSFAVNYIQNDGCIEDLSKILGHKSIKTTQIYGKVNLKRLSAKMDLMESKSIIHQLEPNKAKNLLKAV